MKPPPTPPPAVRAALKEWAAVAAAIRAGRQSILLRAGGIADPAGRFGFSHPWFWIYPTRFHESADRLVPEAMPFVESAAAEGDAIRSLDLLATLEPVQSQPVQSQPVQSQTVQSQTVQSQTVQSQTVQWIDDRAVAERLAPMHILAPAVVRERFDYRQPGLAVALVRVWRRREPHRIVETPAMEGCRSWVELPEPLECDASEPVLSDAAFEAERQRFARLIGH